MPLLSIIIFLPVLGAFFVAISPKRFVKWITTAFMVVDLAFVAYLVANFDLAETGLQFVEHVPWIPAFDIAYYVGVDGLSITMLALSAFLSLIAFIGSWNTPEKIKEWCVMLLLLEAGMNGIFVSLDFVLFYVFWEWVLIPMYFIIAWWGKEDRSYVALKFFLYMLLGSMLILFGIIALYVHPEGGTFDMIELATRNFPVGFQMWVFGLFYFGFAVRVPVWPFHTGHSDAHIQAPTAGSVLLAGVLLKTGVYGLFRVSLPIMEQAAEAWAPFIGFMACAAIIYGSVVAFWQPDLKKMLAYSSVGHMGFAMMGVASGTQAGLNGAMFLAFAHGAVTGMLFLVVGMIYDRAHTRMAPELSGVSKVAPVLGGMLAFVSFASLGLPGLASFAGEFLVLVGTWESSLPRVYTVVVALGMLLGAAYMLWTVYRVVYGTPSEKVEDIPDASKNDYLVGVPLMLVILATGLNWNLLLQFIDPAVSHLLRMMGA